MTKNEIINILNKYNLDKSKFVVIFGSSMVLQDCKVKTEGIHITVSKDYCETLIKTYKCKKIKSYDNNNIYCIDEIIEFSYNFYNPNDIEFVDEIPVQSLQGVMRLKQKLNRDKDTEDIALILKKILENKNHEEVGWRFY